MIDHPQPGAGSQEHPRRDGRALLMLAVVCMLMLGSLALISRQAPSAAQYDSVTLPIAAITPDQGCANFAEYWTADTGFDVPVEAIEGLTNCRLSTTGKWFVPEGADDPRLAERSIPTNVEERQVDALRELILDDFRALEARLPITLTETLANNYAEENLPVFGHTKRGRTDLGVKLARYQRIAQAFLLSPSRALAANYVGWVMERKSLAVAQFEAACTADLDTGYLLRACAGMRREFGISLIPIYWELMNPILIEEYLIWSVRSGLPLPSAMPNATTE